MGRRGTEDRSRFKRGDTTVIAAMDDGDSDIKVVKDGESDADMMSVTGQSMAGVSDGDSFI